MNSSLYIMYAYCVDKLIFSHWLTLCIYTIVIRNTILKYFKINII